mmetsp:Transcript_15812/g.48939  ORF Transcript_15812/g.48939 Transcript_15812/m.48939 type:complete len:170 (-) Transcript_15812:729-1238(-)
MAWMHQNNFYLNIPQLLPGLLRSKHRIACFPWQVEFLDQLAQHRNCDSAVQYYLFAHCVDLNMNAGTVRWLDAWSSSYLFHLQSALRACISASRSRLVACAWAYLHLGMYEEAVDLALACDVFLAKKIADKFEIPLALKRHMWLRVVKHVIRDRSLITVLLDGNVCYIE